MSQLMVKKIDYGGDNSGNELVVDEMVKWWSRRKEGGNWERIKQIIIIIIFGFLLRIIL